MFKWFRNWQLVRQELRFFHDVARPSLNHAPAGSFFTYYKRVADEARKHGYRVKESTYNGMTEWEISKWRGQ